MVAVFGGETVAGAVLMVIILIAEFIVDLNMDRARASIKTLIGSVPQVALMRGADGERVVPIEQLRTGDVVLVRAGEKIPVDGSIIGGAASINEAPVQKLADQVASGLIPVFTDVMALVIAIVAIRLGKRPADRKRTFGYYRFEILAAAFNANAVNNDWADRSRAMPRATDSGASSADLTIHGTNAVTGIALCFGGRFVGQPRWSRSPETAE